MKTFHTYLSHLIEDNRDLLFHGMGFLAYEQGFNQIAYKRDYYSLLFYYDEIELIIQNKVVTIPPRTFIIWPPGSVIGHGRKAKSWGISWLEVWGDFFEQQICELQLPIESPIQFNDHHLIDRHYMDIYNEFMEHSPADIDVLKNLVQRVLLEVARQIKSDSQACPGIPSMFMDSKRFIDVHYREKISRDTIAAITHLNEAYASRKFKQYYGRTPMDYVVELRMKEAMHLLNSTGLRINEIAEQVGYSDIYYFSKLFKKHFNLSPSNYRKKS